MKITINIPMEEAMRFEEFLEDTLENYLDDQLQAALDDGDEREDEKIEIQDEIHLVDKIHRRFLQQIARERTLNEKLS